MYKNGVVYPNLEAEIVRAGINRGELMRLLGLRRTALYNKLIGSSKMTLNEMNTLQTYLELKTGKQFTLEYLFEKNETI